MPNSAYSVVQALKYLQAFCPLLSCFATTIRHMGPVGSGHAAKLISNFLVTGMITLVAQAFGTARKASIDWRDLYEVMLNGSGNSGVLRKMVAPALDGNFEGYRFSLANASKDIGYFKMLASELGMETALADAVDSSFFSRDCPRAWQKERKPFACIMTIEAPPHREQPKRHQKCVSSSSAP